MDQVEARRPAAGHREEGGFRMRGAGMTRVETFTDAAFAFALTLLVVSAETPGSYEELLAALREIPAFAASAVLLLMFWWGHRNWSRRFGLEDGTTVLLSCVLVFTVLVYVYPLRFMASAFMTWIGIMTGWPLGGEPVAMELTEVNGMFVVYGVGWVAMCGCMVLLNLHAWRRSEALELDELERLDTRDEITAWLLVGSAGLLSVGLALTTGSSWFGLPGWAYALLGVVMPLFSWHSERRKARLLAGEAVECWLPPESFEDEAAPVFLDARAFDSPEVGEGEHLFYTDTGKLSFLYRGDPIDPGRLRRPLHRHGPFIHTLERRHVTPGETRNHVIHANLWDQLRPERAVERGEEVPERWLVLCDPRGIGGGAITVRVADFADAEAAVEGAEGLAAALEVRFLVARLRASFCTR